MFKGMLNFWDFFVCLLGLRICDWYKYISFFGSLYLLDDKVFFKYMYIIYDGIYFLLIC